MIDEPTEELASLYAFDLLEGAELAAFEAELARNAGLRALVLELRETAGTLALAAPVGPLPPGLKSRLLARLAEKPRTNDRRIAPLAWIPWAIAACLAFTAAWLAQIDFRQRSESIALHEETELARIEMQSVKNQLEAGQILAGQRLADLQEQLKAADPGRLQIAKLASLPGNPSPARAIAVWDQARQEGVLTVEKLPAIAADQDYQLWVIDPKYPSPVSGGVFTINPQTGEGLTTFRPGRPIATAAKFAVSRERKGGRPTPEGPIVLLSE